MIDRKTNTILVCGVLFAVSGITGSMAAGNAIIVAESGVIPPPLVPAADIIGRVPIATVLGIALFLLGAFSAYRCYHSSFGSTEHNKNLICLHDGSGVPQLLNPPTQNHNHLILAAVGSTVVAIAIGCTIIGNIEPLAANVIQDLVISSGVFAGLGLIVALAYNLHKPMTNDID